MKKNNNIQMPNHPFKTAQDVKRYVRDILLQVQQEETLKKIIDITSKIDYAVIYHLDDDEALARLYELREKKKTGGLSEEEWKELWSLEPDDKIKYIMRMFSIWDLVLSRTRFYHTSIQAVIGKM